MGPSRSTPESPRILIAEDDGVSARFLAVLFSTSGYDVTIVSTGDEAYELAATWKPSVILSSLVMSHPDGFDVLQAVRHDHRFDDVPFVVLSMRNGEDDIVRAFQLGADDYVTKPFNPRELVARVDLLVGGRRVPE